MPLIIGFTRRNLKEFLSYFQSYGLYIYIVRMVLVDIRLNFLEVVLFNNNNNNKLYLHDHNKVLQYCKSYLKVIIDSL